MELGRRPFLIGTGSVLVSALVGCGADERLRGAEIGPDDPLVRAAEKARPSTGQTVRTRLTAAPTKIDLAGRTVDTVAFDDMVPGPLLRAMVGDTIELALRNDLDEDTTIHWHGLALRNDMDGVHGLTQHPIAPGDSFTYRFRAPHPGTYWFHPHVGMQLDRGLYAPLVIDDPADERDVDVDEILVLDDWTDGVGRSPSDIAESLRSMDHSGMGMGDGGMGMGDGGMGMGRFRSELLGGDAGDVSYPLHLVNGRPPADRPTIEARTGTRLRLRVINAASDTAYRVAVGGHRLVVTQSDGFPVEPVEVDTFVIGMGERYDVEVTVASGAWPVVALAEGKDAIAAAVLRTSDAAGTEAPAASDRPSELDGQVLSYADLRPAESVRLPDRRVDVEHRVDLNGSMMPYRWTIGDRPFPDNEAITFPNGARVRLRLRNRSSMWHPIHLHGHTFALGEAGGARKDNVNVLPGEEVVCDVDADNPGQWMIHCHNTYHLEMGMAARVSYER